MACGGTTPRCINGACQPLGAKAVGDSCFASSECQASLGQQAVCKTQTLAGNFQYPDGVCTYERCSASNCPAMSTCIGLSRIFGEETTMCVASNCGTAGTQGTCRSGWVCVGTATTFCIPQAMVQAGAGASYDRTTLIGTPCVSNGACRAPTPGAPGAGGLCISELSRFADGGIRPGADGGVIETGYLSGYCSRDCRSDRDCVSMPPETGDADLSDGVCLGVSTTLAVCFKGCTAPMAGQSNCRPSYVCRALTLRDGGTLPTGYCGPSCTNPGSSCALADGGPGSCNTATGYCN